MTWGLVLSGGAAWGLANVGVLEVLESEGLTPDYIAGSSMGAIVGGLYALGHDVETLKKITSNVSLKNIVKLSKSPLKGGLHGGVFRQELRSHLEPLVKDATIRKCEIPFVCVAGRVKEPISWMRILHDTLFTEQMTKTIEPYVFPPETKMMDALEATSAIPVVFSPVKIGEDEFVDLAIFGAIPSRTLRKIHKPDLLIGTDCNPTHNGLDRYIPPAWRIFLQTGRDEHKRSRDECDLVIEPKLTSHYSRFDHAHQFVEAGRVAAEKALPHIKQIIEEHSDVF